MLSPALIGAMMQPEGIGQPGNSGSLSGRRLPASVSSTGWTRESPALHGADPARGRSTLSGLAQPELAIGVSIASNTTTPRPINSESTSVIDSMSAPCDAIEVRRSLTKMARRR
ncbi:MAG TPA: hypothetical protein VN793_04475 [Acidimicrobiales bacterium]|nr:hypothetical protein [Acidimicrobiales bacterium]